MPISEKSLRHPYLSKRNKEKKKTNSTHILPHINSTLKFRSYYRMLNESDNESLMAIMS